VEGRSAKLIGSALGWSRRRATLKVTEEVGVRGELLEGLGREGKADWRDVELVCGGHREGGARWGGLKCRGWCDVKNV
jgi:hypothetical protein